MTVSEANHSIKYNGDTFPRPIPEVKIVKYVQPKMTVTEDTGYFQIHGMDITDSFDKLMNSDYVSIEGGSKYVRSEPTTGEDLRARDAAIQERARALVGRSEDVRSLHGVGEDTPSSPQKEGSVNDAAQDLTKSPADFQSQNNKSTPNNSGVPQSRRKPGSSKRLEEPE